MVPGLGHPRETLTRSGKRQAKTGVPHGIRLSLPVIGVLIDTSRDLLVNVHRAFVQRECVQGFVLQSPSTPVSRYPTCSTPWSPKRSLVPSGHRKTICLAGRRTLEKRVMAQSHINQQAVLSPPSQHRCPSLSFPTGRWGSLLEGWKSQDTSSKARPVERIRSGQSGTVVGRGKLELMPETLRVCPRKGNEGVLVGAGETGLGYIVAFSWEMLSLCVQGLFLLIARLSFVT